MQVNYFLFFFRKKAASQLAFNLILESQSVEPTTLEFLAPDELVFDYWTDGINALLGKIIFNIVLI